ncbi:MAG: CDP-alcohol phosphatidyltransferase family protein [Ignavibacteriaceae bacterium]|nr:CDP-alcohol phosphatidyltransferase family protein [Ignavibacteriaceae bacterium]
MAIPFWYLLAHIDEGSNRTIMIVLCLLAGVTDILDGYLARKLNQITELGKVIDPLADKICVAIIILQMYLTGMIDATLFYMIVGRDSLIFIGGVFVSKKLGKVLPSNLMGKLTVLIVCFYILYVLFGLSKDTMLHQGFYVIIILMLIISFIAYFIRAIEFLRSKRNESV